MQSSCACMCGMENPCHARVEGPYYQPYNLKLELIFFYKIKKTSQKIYLSRERGRTSVHVSFPPLLRRKRSRIKACMQATGPAGRRASSSYCLLGTHWFTTYDAERTTPNLLLKIDSSHELQDISSQN